MTGITRPTGHQSQSGGQTTIGWERGLRADSRVGQDFHTFKILTADLDLDRRRDSSVWVANIANLGVHPWT